MDRRDRADGRRLPRDDNRSHRPRYGKSSRGPTAARITNTVPEQDRSRSPPRRDRRDDRRRDRSPPRGPLGRGGAPSRADRDRDFHKTRELERGGPRKPDDRTRDAPNSKAANPAGKVQQDPRQRQQDVKMEDVYEDEDSEAEMARVMGFKDFRTTKNTKVPGNDKNYAVHKVKKAEYRQYMNRVGGFNRPLSPSRM